MLAGLNRISSLLEAIPDSREPRAKPEFLRVHLMSGITPSSFWMGCSRIYRIHSFPRNVCATVFYVYLLRLFFYYLSLLLLHSLFLSFTFLLFYFSYAFVYLLFFAFPHLSSYGYHLFFKDSKDSKDFCFLIPKDCLSRTGIQR